MITGSTILPESEKVDGLEQLVHDLKLLTDYEEELGFKIQRLIGKNKQKGYLQHQLEKFDQEHLNHSQAFTELVEYCESSQHHYQDILAEIPKLEARLKLLKMTEKQMSRRFEELADFKLREIKRSKYVLELKEINRNKIDEKIELARAKIRKTRIRIEDQKFEIENYKHQKCLEKEQENEKISSEIKKLQKKLGNAS